MRFMKAKKIIDKERCLKITLRPSSRRTKKMRFQVQSLRYLMLMNVKKDVEARKKEKWKSQCRKVQLRRGIVPRE